MATLNPVCISPSQENPYLSPNMGSLSQVALLELRFLPSLGKAPAAKPTSCLIALSPKEDLAPKTDQS